MLSHIHYERDVVLTKASQNEITRQQNTITLIASENYISDHVLNAYLKAFLSINKYAEGYPNLRYYGGCQYVNIIEDLARERAKQLFNVGYANVQPHSGSQANAAVFMALLNPGDCLLGMGLSDGGHLTHGASVNFSGKFYQSIRYGVNSQGFIDYAQIEHLAQKHKPKLIIAGGSAYSRHIDWKRFREIADQVGAFVMADISHIAGLIAAQLHPSPIDYADVITTTTHKTLRGPRGGIILARDAQFAKKHKLDQAVFPGLQGGPFMHVIAAKAAAFYEALQPNFKIYQAQIIKNAYTMAATLQERGLSIVSGGTDNHLFLVDLRAQAVTGKAVEQQLEQANIIVNKNMLPQDLKPASITSGLRIGTPAITTRGCLEREMQIIAHWIADIISDLDNQDQINSIKNEVVKLCQRFPVYTHLPSSMLHDG